MSSPKSLKQSLPGLWRILRYFWPHVKQHRLLICSSLLALLAEVGLRLLEPWPLKFVFDYVIGSGPRRGPGFLSGLTSADPLVLLSAAAAAVVAITGLRALACFWQTIGFAQIGNRALAQVRKQLHRHVQSLSLSFHASARTGALV